MALIVPSSPSCATKKRHHFLVPKTTQSKPTLLPIKSQKSPTEPPISSQSTDDTSSSIPTPPSAKPSSTGLGFGSSSSRTSNTTANPATTKKNPKAPKGRASVIRRAPVETPQFVSKQDEGKLEEQSPNEKAFLLAWLGLGSIIITQGILLAASGFLPDEWDKIFVKYLYPAFTPTVFLFVIGTVAYGGLKYLQNEKPESPK